MTYCHCGDEAMERGLCWGCLLDALERESLQSGGGPIIQVIDLAKGTQEARRCGGSGL